MKLSPNFTLEEFTRSSIAARANIDNTPPDGIVDNLVRLADLLEEIRSMLAHPIRISSGYRCSALNKLVGSKPSSLHVQGLAADFTCPDYGSPVEVCKAIQASQIEFDKCILEFYNPITGDGWVHIQIGKENRRQMLTINKHGTFAGIRV